MKDSNTKVVAVSFHLVPCLAKRGRKSSQDFDWDNQCQICWDGGAILCCDVRTGLSLCGRTWQKRFKYHFNMYDCALVLPCDVSCALFANSWPEKSTERWRLAMPTSHVYLLRKRQRQRGSFKRAMKVVLYSTLN